MNNATENLKNDHVYILRLTEVMDKMALAGSKNTDHFEKVIQLIKDYADGFHHAKEEKLLFPLLATKGFSLQNGPVAVMINEHVAGRNYVSGMSDALRKYKQGNEPALQIIYGNMQNYANLLRNHIAKENNILFRMADNALSGEDQQNLLHEFEKVGIKSQGAKSSADYVNEIKELESIYGTSGNS